MNRKVSTTRDILTVHTDEIKQPLLLGTGLARNYRTFSFPEGSFGAEIGVLRQPKSQKEGLKMKRVSLFLVLLFVLSAAIPAYAGEGNGVPSGPHYNLEDGSKAAIMEVKDTFEAFNELTCPFDSSELEEEIE